MKIDYSSLLFPERFAYRTLYNHIDLDITGFSAVVTSKHDQLRSCHFSGSSSVSHVQTA